jgi:hypothetical protein
MERSGREELWRLLHDDDDSVRRVAAGLLWKQLDDLRGERLLSHYINDGWHFYNVVRVADALLYAPKWLPREE